VHGTDFTTRRGGEKAEEIVVGIAFFNLSHGGPLRQPKASEDGERTCLVKREPNIAAVRLAEFAKRVERDETAVLWSERVSSACSPVSVCS
jgi:hypothetical protein